MQFIVHTVYCSILIPRIKSFDAEISAISVYQGIDLNGH